MRAQHGAAAELSTKPRSGYSLPPSPQSEREHYARDTWVGPIEMGVRSLSAQAYCTKPDPIQAARMPSAPIRILGRHNASPYGAQRDSFALESPQSVPMMRSISNALSSQPTSYAPSRYISCEYSECGSLKPTIESVLGSSTSRRMSSDQPGRGRLNLFRDHLAQDTRPPSTERKALLDAWRCADMDPPNGAREDGTEHFAFLTDEELQLAQAAEADVYNGSPRECQEPRVAEVLAPAISYHGFKP